MNYTLSFPIYRCSCWAAYRAKLNQKIVLVLRWAKSFQELIQSEVSMLRSLKSQFLPSIQSVIQDQDYVDLVIENGAEWLLNTGQMDEEAAVITILQVFLAYDVLPRDRDCMLENIIKNGDSIMILDFGMKIKQYQSYKDSALSVLCSLYEIYWSPEILTKKSFSNRYQWNLGIMLLSILYGQSSLAKLKRFILDSVKLNSHLDIEPILTDIQAAKNLTSQVKQLIFGLLDLQEPLLWSQIPLHKVFQQHKKCIQLIQQTQNRQVKQKFEYYLPIKQDKTFVVSQNVSPNTSGLQRYPPENPFNKSGKLANNQKQMMNFESTSNLFGLQKSQLSTQIKPGNPSFIQKNQSNTSFEQHKEKIRNSFLFKASNKSKSPPARQPSLSTQIKFNMKKIQQPEDPYFVKQERGRILKKKNLIQQSHVCDLSLNLTHQEARTTSFEANTSKLQIDIENQKQLENSLLTNRTEKMKQSFAQAQVEGSLNLSIIKDKDGEAIKQFDSVKLIKASESQFDSDNQSPSNFQSKKKISYPYSRYNSQNNQKEFTTQATSNHYQQEYESEESKIKSNQIEKLYTEDDNNFQESKQFLKSFSQEIRNPKSKHNKKQELSIYAKQRFKEVNDQSFEQDTPRSQKSECAKKRNENQSETPYFIQSPPLIKFNQTNEISSESKSSQDQCIKEQLNNVIISPETKNNVQLQKSCSKTNVDDDEDVTLLTQKVQQNEILIAVSSTHELVVEDLENSIELHKKKIAQKTEQPLSVSSQDEEELSDQIDNLEQFSQVSKSTSFTKFEVDYTLVLQCINLVGTSAVKCMEYLNAIQNFWIIPLFLVFKRMYQLRIQIENIFKAKENILNHEEWELITKNEVYEQLAQKIKEENLVVKKELLQILQAAKKKCSRLERARQNKVDWFLNEDPTQDINSTMFVYYCQQVYTNIVAQIKQQPTKPKVIEWWKLAIEVQGALLVSGSSPLNYKEVDYDGIQKMLKCDSTAELEEYHREKEKRLQNLKQQLIQKGYKL